MVKCILKGSDTMKRYIAAVLSLVMLTGCQVSGGSQSAKPTSQAVKADRDNVPAVRFIKHIDANEYTSDVSTMSFIDSEGKWCVTDNSELMALSNAALTEKYAAGELKGYTVQAEVDRDKLAETYDMICEAAESEDYDLIYPEMMPDVEASTTTVSAMYCTTDGELKSIVIYENKCMTPIHSNCPAADEAYDWYRNALKK